MPDIKLTPVALEMLALAFKQDPYGRLGIPAWASAYLPLEPYDAVQFMLSHGILERNIFGYIVPTEDGKRLYQAAMQKEEQE